MITHLLHIPNLSITLQITIQCKTDADLAWINIQATSIEKWVLSAVIIHIYDYIVQIHSNQIGQNKTTFSGGLWKKYVVDFQTLNVNLQVVG